MAITGCRPRCGTVNLAVRDGDTLGWVASQDDVLSSDKRSLDMVNPNQIYI